MKLVSFWLVLAAIIATTGCCTHPDVSAEVHQIRLVLQHYNKNTIPNPALPPVERAKITQEGSGLDGALSRVETMLK